MSIKLKSNKGLTITNVHLPSIKVPVWTQLQNNCCLNLSHMPYRKIHRIRTKAQFMGLMMLFEGLFNTCGLQNGTLLMQHHFRKLATAVCHFLHSSLSMVEILGYRNAGLLTKMQITLTLALHKDSLNPLLPNLFLAYLSSVWVSILFPLCVHCTS